MPILVSLSISKVELSWIIGYGAKQATEYSSALLNYNIYLTVLYRLTRLPCLDVTFSDSLTLTLATDNLNQ